MVPSIAGPARAPDPGATTRTSPGASSTATFTVDFADSDPGLYTSCRVGVRVSDYVMLSRAGEAQSFDCLDAARTNGSLQGLVTAQMDAGTFDNSAVIMRDYDGRLFRRGGSALTGPLRDNPYGMREPRWPRDIGADDVRPVERPPAPAPVVEPPPARPGPASTGSDGVLRIPLVNGLVFSKAGAYEEVRDTSNRVHNWTFDGTTDVQEIHDGTLRVVWRIDRATGTGDKTVIENGAVVSSVPATASDAPVWQGAAATGIPDRR